METADYLIYICVYFWLALFGACIGSFLNVVVYRLPKGNFFSRQRSYCPLCERRLAWYDLIPILSWLLLRGRCRCCSGRISPRYPLTEAAAAVFAALCFARFGFSLKTPLSFGILAVLLVVALIDWETMEIPHSLIIALIPFAVGAVWVWTSVSILERVIGFFSVSTPMLLLALLISGAFGGGDIKLMAVCGFMLGWQNTLLAFFIALLTGGVYAAYLLATGKGKIGARIAFGPYLCIGTAVSIFWGEEMLRFYVIYVIGA